MIDCRGTPKKAVFIRLTLKYENICIDFNNKENNACELWSNSERHLEIPKENENIETALVHECEESASEDEISMNTNLGNQWKTFLREMEQKRKQKTQRLSN